METNNRQGKQRMGLVTRNNHLDFRLYVEWNGQSQSYVSKLLRQAWSQLGNMKKEEAAKNYVKELDKLAPKWREYTPKAKL